MSTYFNPDPKKYAQPKLKTGLKQKMKEPTGELKIFKEIFVERGGKCEITGEPIQFSPECFMHVLNKNNFKRFRLYKRNIFMVVFDVHNCYDNGSIEHLLAKYPKAKMIYERKEELIIEFHKPQPTV